MKEQPKEFVKRVKKAELGFPWATLAINQFMQSQRERAEKPSLRVTESSVTSELLKTCFRYTLLAVGLIPMILMIIFWNLISILNGGIASRILLNSFLYGPLCLFGYYLWTADNYKSHAGSKTVIFWIVILSAGVFWLWDFSIGWRISSFQHDIVHPIIFVVCSAVVAILVPFLFKETNF